MITIVSEERTNLMLTAYGAGQRDIDGLTSLTGRADEATWCQTD